MENFIEVYKNILPSKTCDYIVETINKNMDLSYSGRTARGVSKVKKSTDIDLLRIMERTPEFSKIIPDLQTSLNSSLINYTDKYDWYGSKRNSSDKEKLAHIYKYNLIHCHSLHAKMYEPGKDFFEWHIDSSPTNWLTYSRELVAMFYLNDVTEGGETEFLPHMVSIKPTKGSLVIFPAGWTHKHRGKMPISNKKYILNFWVYSKNPAIEEYIDELKTIDIKGKDYKFNWI
tara:strand:+ start:866 stop:1558 length:693 start_codon:yes stop_codon:yes gene_type:complete